MITAITNNDATRDAFCFWAREMHLCGLICAPFVDRPRRGDGVAIHWNGMPGDGFVPCSAKTDPLYFASTWLGASYENVCQRYTSIRYAIHSDSFGSLIVDSSLSHAARALPLPLSISCNLQVAGFDPQRRLCDSRHELGRARARLQNP